MTTFIQTKLKKSDDQTNIDKVAANITEYHTISKLIFLRIIIPKSYDDKAIISCKIKNVKNQIIFPSYLNSK